VVAIDWLLLSGVGLLGFLGERDRIWQSGGPDYLILGVKVLQVENKSFGHGTVFPWGCKPNSISVAVGTSLAGSN